MTCTYYFTFYLPGRTKGRELADLPSYPHDRRPGAVVDDGRRPWGIAGRAGRAGGGGIWARRWPRICAALLLHGGLLPERHSEPAANGK